MTRIPILRFHRPTRQWYVWEAGTKSRKYLGADPDQARQRYAEFVASLNGEAPPPVPTDRGTVAEALEHFRRYAVERYQSCRFTRCVLSVGLDAVADLYGRQPAGAFRARALREVRRHLLTGGDRPRSRNYVNRVVRYIQLAWRWLAAEELVPAESAASIASVRPLGRGEGGVERPVVTPPPPGAVDAVLPLLSVELRRMVRVQLLTGMRPGELCRLAWEDISRDPTRPIPVPGTRSTVSAIEVEGVTVWVYAPRQHKTLWRGKSRLIPIGPAAQKILLEIGERDSGLVFPNQRGRLKDIKRYCEKIRLAWRKAGVERWTPNMLRHARACEVAEQFDDHTAATILGHAAGSTAVATYVKQSLAKAARAAAKAG